MRFKYLACLLMTRSLLVAEQSTWVAYPGDGSWQAAENWTNGVPGITGSIKNLDLEAIFPLGSGISVNLADSVKLNKMRVDQDCTLSGKSLSLIGPIMLSINDAKIIFENKLIMSGEGEIINNGLAFSQLTIKNELICSSAKINGSGSSTDYLGPFFKIENATGNITNSEITIESIILENSSLYLTKNTNFSATGFSMDSSSSITLTDSQFTCLGNDPVQPINITFVLTKNFVKTPYFKSDVANIDLSISKNQIHLEGSLPSGSNTFTLYQGGLPSKIQGFSQESFDLPQKTRNIIWNVSNKYLDMGSVVITADVQHSVSASIRSVMSTSSQVTLSTARQLENSRQNARISDPTYLSANSSQHDDFHVAQNTILSQSTPVEQLWERGVYRPCHNWSVYMAPLGSFGSTKSKNLQPGSDFYTAGFFAGFDWVNSYHPQSDVGFGLGSTFYYSRLHADTEHHVGKVDVDHIFANIYGTVFPRKLEELSFNFGLGAGYNWYDMERVTGHFGSLVAHSETKGHEIGSFAGIEYLFSSVRNPRMGNFRFMPMFYLQYNRLEINDYSEYGAGEFNVRVRSDDLDSLRSFLGARANYLFTASQNVTVRPEITIGWQREYFSDSVCSSFNTIELATPQGVCSTIAPERNTLIVGADMYVKMFQWTSLELNYQFTCNNLLRDHEFYLQWKFEF